MADVAWVNGTTFAHVTSATSISANAPTGLADDDTLLAAVFTRSAATTPSGWTKIAEIAGGFNDGLTTQYLSVFSKDAVTTGDAGASFTFQQASAGRIGVVYGAMRNVTELVSYGTATENAVVDDLTIAPDVETATANGQMLVIFASTVVTTGATAAPSAPASFTIFSGASVSNLRLAGAYRAVNSGQANSGNFNLDTNFVPEFEIGNGLGAITLLFGSTAEPIDGYIEDPGPLGSPLLLGTSGFVAHVLADSPLGAPALFGFHDFTAAGADAVISYAADLITPSGTVRVPISSWQATLNVTNDSYAQCVIPACLPYVDDINAATEFVITRYADTGATVLEHEILRFPVSQVFFAQGSRNYTATISGYDDGYVEDLDPPTTYDRVLSGVQTVMSYPTSTTVRCAIDPLLRPAQRAYLGAVPMIVSFVSFYVTSNGDQYMDVGERSA